MKILHYFITEWITQKGYKPNLKKKTKQMKYLFLLTYLAHSQKRSEIRLITSNIKYGQYGVMGSKCGCVVVEFGSCYDQKPCTGQGVCPPGCLFARG